MAQGLVCLVTVHGVGFEEAPENGQPGYADTLHDGLSRVLGSDTLGDDPGDTDPALAEKAPPRHGPVYVQSRWPPDSNDREHGLQRLDQPLVIGDQPIAHVALVYTHLEPLDPHAGSGTIALAMSVVAALRYATFRGGLHVIRALLLPSRPQQSPQAKAPALRARTLTPRWHPGGHTLLPPFHKRTGAPRSNPTGLRAVVLNLQNDVCTYVARDDLRQSVRDFVHAALLRLASRPDVAAIVLNGHSNGTVVAFDAARSLPPACAAKLRWFVTAGSAMRKYGVLFNWDAEVGRLHAIDGWTNFWDRQDPVADPLTPGRSWRRGRELPRQDGRSGFFFWDDPDSGERSFVPLEDREVDNVHNGGGGGLPAHDYWRNKEQFVRPLAEILKQHL